MIYRLIQWKKKPCKEFFVQWMLKIMFSISIDEHKKSHKTAITMEVNRHRHSFRIMYFYFIWTFVYCENQFNAKLRCFILFMATPLLFEWFSLSLCELFCKNIRISFFVQWIRCWFVGRKCWIQKVFENRFGNHFFNLRFSRWSCFSSFRVKFIVCLCDSLMYSSYVLYRAIYVLM